jgi:hypothetical protein
MGRRGNLWIKDRSRASLGEGLRDRAILWMLLVSGEIFCGDHCLVRAHKAQHFMPDRCSAVTTHGHRNAVHFERFTTASRLSDSSYIHDQVLYTFSHVHIHSSRSS